MRGRKTCGGRCGTADRVKGERERDREREAERERDGKKEGRKTATESRNPFR